MLAIKERKGKNKKTESEYIISVHHLNESYRLCLKAREKKWSIDTHDILTPEFSLGKNKEATRTNMLRKKTGSIVTTQKSTTFSKSSNKI